MFKNNMGDSLLIVLSASEAMTKRYLSWVNIVTLMTGPRYPVQYPLLLRRHLEMHYCSRCGEYIYFPHHRNPVQHVHYSKQKKLRYIPLLLKRVLIHRNHNMVEWERHFPKVLSFQLRMESKKVCFWRNRKIPASMIWSLPEWNFFYPEHTIDPSSFLLKRLLQYPPDKDPLWVPNSL